MCSVEEDIEELGSSNCSSSNRVKSPLLELGKCRKCDQPSAILLHRKDPLCKDCFISYCNHKFRSTIGKNQKIKREHKILVAYSGGSCSAAMIHLVFKALNDANHKRVQFVPGIVHIFENIQSSNVIAPIEAHMRLFDFPVLFSSIQLAFRENDDNFYFEIAEDTIKFTTDCLQAKFDECMNNISTLSSKQDYLECLRMQLIADIADHAGYDYLFMGNSATNLATKLLSSISLGKGSQISSNTNFSDERYNIPVLRPMREFLNKECVFYNHLSNVPSFVQPTILTMTRINSSIQRLTENFVSTLQEKFPATIFTIFRIGGKIAATSSKKSGETICWICQSPRDNSNVSECSAIEALNMSSKLSQPTKNEKIERNSLSEDLQAENLVFNEHLCHGCGIAVSEMKNFSCLPPQLYNKISDDVKRERMREEIKDFILEEDNEQ